MVSVDVKHYVYFRTGWQEMISNKSLVQSQNPTKSQVRVCVKYDGTNTTDTWYLNSLLYGHSGIHITALLADKQTATGLNDLTVNTLKT